MPPANPAAKKSSSATKPGAPPAQPRATASPARKRATKCTSTKSDEPPTAVPTQEVPTSDSDVWKSIKVYLGCVLGLFALLGLVLSNAPTMTGDACTGLGFSDLLGRGDKRQAVIKLYKCASAYQKQNEFFVTCMFELTYVGLKMFAIPAAFILCVLSGALFPLWQAQLLTGVGEAVGSSLCYLLSKAIARPILERYFADKLAMLQERAKAEREHMLLFNFFLRLTPLAPNWFINVASPIIGVPLAPFFIASLFGTQVTLVFQCGLGAALRTVGEEGFSLGWEETKKGMYLVAIMGVVQMVPLALIRRKKRAADMAAVKVA